MFHTLIDQRNDVKTRRETTSRRRVWFHCRVFDINFRWSFSEISRGRKMEKIALSACHVFCMVCTLIERSSRTISAREIPLTSFTGFLSLLYRNENPCYSISGLNMFCSRSSRSSVFTSWGSREVGGFCGGRSLSQSKPFRMRFWMATFRSCIPSISFSILSCWDIRIASSRTVVAI